MVDDDHNDDADVLMDVSPHCAVFMIHRTFIAISIIIIISDGTRLVAAMVIVLDDRSMNEHEWQK